MKVAFKHWFIGFVILTILLFGETTIAQKGKGVNQCNETLTNKKGTCDANQCKAACAKRHKTGHGICTTGEDNNKGKVICTCHYQCPR
uniref:Knottin scorpion toxin-like domain-containing protein n=1 Tax=Brassica oleracea TaxID=3712 RepID=A0A3P6FPJ6_BRAOL|nr:unnamed protein product [Brassica oleracea]